MFATRNIVDRIIPFFALVLMNFFIIIGLKEDQRKTSTIKGAPVVNMDNGRGSVKDATRALISVITMYLLSQSLQVLITFWEAFHRESLEEEYAIYYSYLNDIMSILTLVSSAMHFPIYCVCNRPIYHASVLTLQRFKTCILHPREDIKTLDCEYKTVGVSNPSIDQKLLSAGVPTNVSLKNSDSDDSTVAMVNLLGTADCKEHNWTL
ncbi:hypothetical protein L596_022405 [Steinernema carpocapsae]|uniref:G-protein coupled receptors family 1 profile domain-containing protein n=2 Tax=Steinernema carpocapsae TaxID=34508 RepID=A0A4U5MLK5_STECR|nr:hypothetical protein L596_022405 [Steinernema carpocapsae]